jgi:plasmanylethanolamine desaturase
MSVIVGSSLGALAVSVLAADLVSGVVHWAEDAYARFKPKRTVRFFNVVARDNKRHHLRPREFLRRSWWQSSWDLLALGSVILGVAYAMGHLSWALIVFVALSVNANQIHKWAHQNAKENPRLVTWLQRMRLMQGARDHGKHHGGERDSHYCVITTALNPVLERLQFWRRLERAIEVVTGKAPKAPY